MANDPVADAPTDTSALDLNALAVAVQESYAQNGASGPTIDLMRRYVAAYLEQAGQTFPPVSSDQRQLVTTIQTNLGILRSDAELSPMISQQIEDWAAGKQAASVSQSQPNVSIGGDPIEMFSGEFQVDTTDLTISGAGMDFVFRRIYKSRAVYFGPLGTNWDHAYNLHIRESGPHLIRTSGELRDDLYTRHPQFGQAGFDYWVPPDGRHGIIEVDGTSFAWRGPNGVRFLYERSVADATYHRIRKIEDRFGNYLLFSYEQDLLDAVQVNHPARKVTFLYDTADRIIHVRDYTDRQWTYEYDDFGDLSAVTSPATLRYASGLSTRYEYSSMDYSPPSQHNLLRIFDPAGQLYLENEYGVQPGLLNFNRVVRQRQGRGEYFFDYQSIPEEFEFEYSDSERPAIQVDHVLRNGQQVHFIYNKFGNMLLREEYLRQGPFNRLAQWRFRYNRDGSLIATITPEGCITQYYYGRDDYLLVFDITDEEVATDSNLTAAKRMGFGNLLAVVRRHKRYDFDLMDFSLGVWGDFYPNVLMAIDRDDIIVKYTYESDYQQLLTVSDPRVTASADPRFGESMVYDNHLTRYDYSALPLKSLSQIRYPDTTYPSPMPNGVTGLRNTVEEYIQYDSAGRLRRARDPEGYVHENTYVSGGVADPKTGYLESTTRDTNGLQLSTRYDVNSVGLTLSVQNPRGVRTTFVVNELNQTTERITGGPGYKTRYFYDRNGLLERQESDNLDDRGQPSADGNDVKTYKYDELGNLRQEASGAANLTRRHVTRHRYDASDCRVETVFPMGNRVRFGYEERSLLRSTTRGALSDEASTTRVLYDADGRKVALIDGRGNCTTYEYDTFGRLTSVTDPLGGVAQQVYDKLGNITLRRFFEWTSTGTYRLLTRASVDYDERGSLVRQTDYLFSDPILTLDIRKAPDAEFTVANAQGLVTPLVTELFHDRNKRLVRRTNARSQETTWTYDGADRPSREQDSLGNYVETSYDENSNVTRVDRHELVRDPSTGAVVREDVFTDISEYDLLDRRVVGTDGLGNRTVFTYDSRGNVASVTDPLGNVRRFRYDGFNRKAFDIAEMTDTGLGGGTRLPDIVTQHTYDDNDRQQSIIDPNGHATEFAYDDLNRHFKTTFPDGTAIRVTHDADDNVVIQQDNNGLQVRFIIDPLGRRTRADIDTTLVSARFLYPTEADTFERYVYDGLGRPVEQTNDYAAIATEFDSLGRAQVERIQYSVPFQGPPNPLVLARTHDELSNRTDVTYPSGRSIHYDYDDLNHVISIANEARGAAYPGSMNLPAQYEIAGYDYRGVRVDTVRYGNQATCAFAYDGAGRVIGIRHGSGGNAFLEIAQLFDDAGNRRFQFDTPAPVGSPNGEIYEFDSAYRVTRFAPRTIAAFNAAQFEPAGAPVAAPALTGQQAIDTVIGSLSRSLPDEIYEYDAVGNREEEHEPGQLVLAYDVNSLNQYSMVGGTSYEYDLNGNLVDDGTFRYSYNYRNRLVRAVRKVTSTDALVLFHDALGRLIVFREGGQPIFLVNDGLHAVEEYTDTHLTCQYVYENGIDRRCQMAAGGEEWWYHRDLLSSPRVLTDSTGQPIATPYRFAPFGRLITGPVNSNAFLFSGKRLFNSIGVYDSRARHYSPSMGRFLQRDPAGFADGGNLYAYGGNNPVSFTDPLGTNKTAPSEPERPKAWQNNPIRPSAASPADAEQAEWRAGVGARVPLHERAELDAQAETIFASPESHFIEAADRPPDVFTYIPGARAGWLLPEVLSGETITGAPTQHTLRDVASLVLADWVKIELLAAGAGLIGGTTGRVVSFFRAQAAQERWWAEQMVLRARLESAQVERIAGEQSVASMGWQAHSLGARQGGWASSFPAFRGGPNVTNPQAQRIVYDILTSKEKLVLNYESGTTITFDKVTGRGITFDANNRMVGFRDMASPQFRVRTDLTGW